MNVQFYHFSKRENSTKVVSGTAEATINVILKDNATVDGPIIELSTGFRPGWTYAYIPDFARYYFVTGYSYYRGLWTVTMSVDVLATYRSDVLSLTTFVERSASSYDEDIADDLLSGKQLRTEVNRSGVSLWTPFDTVGCYIVRIASSASSDSPTGIELYALTAPQLGSLLSYLYDATNFSEVIKEEFVKAVFNPLDYIQSIKWFPILPEDTGGELQTIRVGWFDTGISGLRMIDYGKSYTKTIKPFDRYYGDWRDRHPNFTRYDLYIPSYGMIEIPPDAFYVSANQLHITMSIDYSTGQIFTYITTGGNATSNSCILTTLCGQIGVDVQVSQLLPNIGGAVSSITSVLSSVATGDILGAASKAVNSVQTVANPTVKTLGSTGSVQGLIDNPAFELSRYVYGSAEYPITVAGRPLMRNVQLSTLSGYCKCGNASIQISALESERTAINNYLNTGFYIE